MHDAKQQRRAHAKGPRKERLHRSRTQSLHYSQTECAREPSLHTTPHTNYQQMIVYTAQELSVSPACEPNAYTVHLCDATRHVLLVSGVYNSRFSSRKSQKFQKEQGVGQIKIHTPLTKPPRMSLFSNLISGTYRKLV